MKVIDCPKCGGTVEKTTIRVEYGSNTRWECENCDWYYKKGKGIGVGTSGGGTHPKNVTIDSKQKRLVDVGEYCSDCETVVAGNHDCSLTSVLGDTSRLVENVIDELSEHYTKSEAKQKIESAIKDESVVLTPTFYYIQLYDQDVFEKQMELVETEIRNAINNNQNNNSFSKEDEVVIDTVHRRMCADRDIEKTFITKCIEALERRGDVKMYHGKVKIRS